ncbi:hypothetical protein TCELL_0156 [Thermogladius calderae 1633]|uniref:Uncharacterized protein n=1 Tax=Thermogladius calderae (strain DSM 22663 / VKM B-2946 / 1633) TaxID=1184251 RepID=I3TCU3_THEC1|nr:hypothetical protein TCELL_0156 [Thermogladius calderae 1633]
MYRGDCLAVPNHICVSRQVWSLDGSLLTHRDHVGLVYRVLNYNN